MLCNDARVAVACNDAAFNSLFEMPEAVFVQDGAEPAVLSILYLRCGGEAAGEGRRRRLRRLSILYLRCGVDRHAETRLDTCVKLSILYLRCCRLRSVCCAQRKTARTFNSLFEMRVPTGGAEATSADATGFQFSI